MFFCRILVAETGLGKSCHSDGVVPRLTTAVIKAEVVNTVLLEGLLLLFKNVSFVPRASIT